MGRGGSGGGRSHRRRGPEVDGTAAETLDFSNDLLLPGLVDMHAHPARLDSRCRWRCPETAVGTPCCEYT